MTVVKMEDDDNLEWTFNCGVWDESLKLGNAIERSGKIWTLPGYVR